MNPESRKIILIYFCLGCFYFSVLEKALGQQEQRINSLDLLHLENAREIVSNGTRLSARKKFDLFIDAKHNYTDPVYSAAICSTNPLNQGLVGYYKFDGSASDHSGANAHGTLYGVKNMIGNPPSFSTGIQNQALRLENFNHDEFTQPNCYAKLPKTRFNSKTGFSVSFWVNFVSSAVEKSAPDHDESIYTVQNCTDNIFTVNVTSSGGVYLNYSKGSTYGYNSSKFNMGKNTWTHLSAVVRNDTMHFFANGSLISSNYFSRESVNLSSLDQYIGYHCWGSSNASSRFNGFVDELRVYQRALSNSEVQQLFGSNNPICAKNNLQLYGPPGASSYVWSGPNNFGSNQQNPVKLNINTSDSGIYKLISSFGACKDTFSTQVLVKDCPCRYRDSLELVNLYNTANGPNWKNNWTLSDPINTWHGIDLNIMGCVECIDLDGVADCSSALNAVGNQLEGNLPNNFGNFSALKFLHLAGNKLSGSIPKSLGNMPELTQLDLNSNQLTGGIPSELGDLSKLEFLYLHNNKLGGEIPPTFGKLLSMRSLFLYNDQLTGRIPSELGQMTRLKFLALNDNKLEGSLPSTLSNLKELEYISVANNRLSGTIPSTIGNFPRMDKAYLYNNQFEGSISSEWSKCLLIKELLLQQNRLTNIPNWSTSSLPRNMVLNLSENRLTFSSIVPNRVFTLAYTPQDSIYKDTLIQRSIGQALSIDLGIDASINDNLYTWTKNGQALPPITGNNKLEISALQAADAGIYRVRVTNPRAPTLTLYSKAIRIVVNNCTGIANAKLNSSAPSDNICSGSSVSLSASGGTTYRWSTGQTTSSINLSVTQNQTVTVSITDAVGCSQTLTKGFVAIALPKAEITSPSTNICAGGKLTLTASPVSGAQYEWLLNNASVLGPGLANTYEATMAGSYTVRVTAAGCTSTSVAKVLQQGSGNPAIKITLSPTRDTICPGDSVRISANGGLKYTWSTGSSSSAIVVRPVQSSTYAVTIADATNCNSILRQTISIVPAPQARISLSELSCGYTLLATATGGKAPYLYRWSTNSTNNSVTVTQKGNYELLLVDARQCSSKANIMVDSFSFLTTAPILLDPNCGARDGSISLRLNPKREPYQIEWEPSGEGQGDNPRTQLDGGTYQALIMDKQGCMDTLVVTLIKQEDCDKDFLIYRSFSPNRDGDNDYFVIQAKRTGGCPSGVLNVCYPHNELIIFNRWGEKVYRKQGYSSEWDADGLPGGAYFFLFYPDNDRPKGVIKGALTIIK